MAETMLTSKVMERSYDRFLRTICNKSRLAIIQSLFKRSKNVSRLTEELGMHQASVSHELKRLLDCGFVFVERNGKERNYTLNKKTIMPLLRLMDEHINSYCSKVNCRGS